MKSTTILVASMALSCLTYPVWAENKEPEPTAPASVSTDKQSLSQIALLLDTSGSMEGLIDQARCQLWNVVSELATASKDGSPSRLEIAVYQYGSKQISKENGFLRQVIGFTDNLDEVSRALFSLSVGGSDEFCGQVIDHALTELEWNPSPDTYKAVFIAGNESFEQGPVTFGEALPKALSQSVIVNSIYCASEKQKNGREVWDSAATLAGGMYFQIDHNHHLPQMKTPFDSQMRELNEQMNQTFVWYGDESHHVSENQKNQDANAAEMSDHAFAARMSAKIGHLYHHAHHDLVDALDHGTVDLATMPEAKMPSLLQKMSPEARMPFLEEKIAERDRVRRQMADVISKRHAYLQQKMSEQSGKDGEKIAVLGDALIEAVRNQAIERGFQFKQEEIAQVSN